MSVIMGPTGPGPHALIRMIDELNEQQLHRFGDIDDRWTDIEIAKRCRDIERHDIDEARVRHEQ